MVKNGFLIRKPSFPAQKKHSAHYSNHVLATTGQSCANKKVLFSQIDISLFANCKEVSHRFFAMRIPKVLLHSPQNMDFWPKTDIFGPFEKNMQTRCLGGFSVTWVPKLLLPPIKNWIFGPKRAEFGP